MLSKLPATFLPRHLRYQLILLSSLVLLITITVYAWYSANEQAQFAQDRDELDVVALAQNIAVTSTDAIILKNFTEIENLLVRTLALPHTLEVRITDARGRLLSHAVSKPGGKPEVRFGARTIDTPAATNAATRIDYSQPASGWRYQLGLGDPGRMVVWQPIFSETLLGWVVVDHDVAPTTEIRKHIWLDSLIVGVIAITANILLLLLFLKRPMGTLQTATNFAAKLDESGGAQLPVFHGTTEIESLTTALNIVSTRLFAQNTDLNKQKLVVAARTAELSQFKNTLDQTLDCVFMFDPDTLRFTYVNEGAKRQVGYSGAELMQMTPVDLTPEFTLEQFQQAVQPLIEGVLPSLTFQTLQRHKDGHDVPVEAFLQLVRLEGQSPRFVAMVSDISERQAAQKRIEFLAYHDTLTGLPNRLLAEDHLEQAILVAERENSRVALLFIDLDNFKTINDSLGHVIGDELLKGVAIRLRECLRDIDTLSRQGGDEFLIVLNNMRDTESITVVAEKILERMAKPFEIDHHELSISLSIGIAVYPDDGKDFDTLLKQSDTAMYQAKESGRNTHRFHTAQMNIDAVEHLRMRNGLRRALEHGEFVLYYQPQISLATGAVIGAEALIRWNHPELGMVPPGRFTSVAEDSGLIVPMGEWVLREACRQTMAWRRAGLPELLIAVNLSAVQFKRGDVLKSVTQALAESGLEPALLELELTESILIKDTEKVLATVRQLKSLGIKLSIDDFGTGYSSLSYLKRFDVDKLKIDQSFVRDMTDDPNDAAIVRAIIQMAKSLNLTTIAEGVEDEHQLALLRLQHCDEAQGYHFARPMPADEFENFMKRVMLH